MGLLLKTYWYLFLRISKHWKSVDENLFAVFTVMNLLCACALVP